MEKEIIKNEVTLNLLKGENLGSVTNKIQQGKTIILVVKSACILIEKFDWGYEVNTIIRSENKWEIIKCNDYSLKVTLSAIFQSPQIRKTLIYLCKCNNDMKKPYIEIADALLLVDNQGKDIIKLNEELEPTQEEKDEIIREWAEEDAKIEAERVSKLTPEEVEEELAYKIDKHVTGNWGQDF